MPSVGPRRIVGYLDERMRCDVCGLPIEAGESWMAEVDDGSLVAHAGCVYSEELDSQVGLRWQPQERAAG